MKMKTSYHTKQKELIYEFFRLNPDKQYSAKEVSDTINQSAKIGESTVYRLIKKLTDDGEIRRFQGKNAKSVVYQFSDRTEHCTEHFHLKCLECGALKHLDCDLVSSLEQHMGNHHGFTIDPVKTIFYGTCAACKNLAKEQI